MTGMGHRIVTFAVIGGITGSPLAATLGGLSAAIPDTLEYMLFGRARIGFHRKFTHWFVPWLMMAALCFCNAGWGIEYDSAWFSIGAMPLIADMTSGVGSFIWACAAFWFLGPLMHIAEDACCGKVPFLLPWGRGFGVYLFRMSPRIGVMSKGEMIFTIIICVLSLTAWFVHGIIF